MYIFLYVGVHMYVMHVLVDTCMCACEDPECHSAGTMHLFFETMFLLGLGLLAVYSRDPLIYTFPAMGLQTHLVVFVGLWESNSGPYVCVANI